MMILTSFGIVANFATSSFSIACLMVGMRPVSTIWRLNVSGLTCMNGAEARVRTVGSLIWESRSAGEDWKLPEELPNIGNYKTN